ncbi:MAG: Rpn family recombination-promoting nuclease/putative transposase [Muribaculaceae bacterium]
MCTERYIHPFTDFGFKKIFGSLENKHLLIRILNDLLECNDPIEDLTYIDPKELGVPSIYYMSIYYMCCQTNSGARIIVNIQNMYPDLFKNRSFYYSNFSILESVNKSEWSYNPPPIYTIIFMNHYMQQFCDDPEPKHTARICDVSNGRVLYDKLTYVYIEMPKVVKPLEELGNPVERWFWAIKNMNDLDEYPKSLKDEIFRELFRVSEIYAFTKEERMAYEESLKNMRDWNNILNTAVKKSHEEGKEKGREEGLQEGREEERRILAKQMIAAGLSISKVAEITGLSTETIENL